MVNHLESEVYLYGNATLCNVIAVPSLLVVLRSEIGVVGWIFLALLFGFLGYGSIWLRNNPLISITFVAFRVNYLIGIASKTKAVNLEDIQCWWVKMATLYVQSTMGERLSVSLMLLDEDAKQRLFATLEALGIPFGEPQKVSA